jgi:ribosomal protein S18 acetylase RimI-like enzyme
MENNEGIIGFYSVVTNNVETSLEYFYIEPKYIGQGYGRILWNHMVSTFKEKENKEITLVTSPQAKDFYIKMGAVETGIVDSIVIKNRKIPSLVYKFEKTTQPEYIYIDETLRLRKFDGLYDFALSWYEDEDTVKLVSGEHASLYDYERLTKMYNYLNNKGELYFIEAKKAEEFIPIGDVTFWKDDMPIVIGDKNYRGIGIGYKVIKALLERAKVLGYEEIFVNEIYSYNTGSRKAFEKAGFKRYKETENGASYKLEL